MDHVHVFDVVAERALDLDVLARGLTGVNEEVLIVGEELVFAHRPPKPK